MAFVDRAAHLNALDAGQHTTVTASDNVQTDLREVLYVSASLNSDPVAGAQNVSVVIPNQVTSPGIITIKTWKATATGDTAQIAATTFSKVVNWIAMGR